MLNVECNTRKGVIAPWGMWVSGGILHGTHCDEGFDGVTLSAGTGKRTSSRGCIENSREGRARVHGVITAGCMVRSKERLVMQSGGRLSARERVLRQRVGLGGWIPVARVARLSSA